jgi:hypothetical protein
MSAGLLDAADDSSSMLPEELMNEFRRDHTTALPMATVFVVDTDRVIRWIDVRPDCSSRTSVQTSLPRWIPCSRTPDT